MLRRAGFVNAESSPPDCKHTGNNVDFAWDGGHAKWNHLSGERDDNAENHILLTEAGTLDPNTCADNIAPMHFCLQSLTKVRQLLVKVNYSDCHVNLTTAWPPHRTGTQPRSRPPGLRTPSSMLSR
jgi:hypothetical protein